ncbi:unnamed protein product [Candida verbasci]|uniref:Cation efflux protein transmembrane domain-containing protein n=1 Tax=Candida verbasci TaxID=1227364 RepID=A0A9W4TPF3_9ASCO|nr:unnamed protein product [Candida verbasci]
MPSSSDSENSPLLNKNNKTNSDYTISSRLSTTSSSPRHLKHTQYSSPASLLNLKRSRSGGNLSSNHNDEEEGNSSNFTEFEEFQHPRRNYSFGAKEYQNLNPDKPLYQRLLSNYQSVTNPQSPFDSHYGGGGHYLPLFSAGDYEEPGKSFDHEQRRMSIVEVVNSLRPTRLIGNIQPLANWYEYYKSNIKSIKNKQVRKYFEEQNYLIEKFQEIDNFLDAGKIHYNMLTQYGADSLKLNKIAEEDESKNGIVTTNKATDLEHGDSTTTSKYSRFYDVPGNVDHDGSKFLGYNEEENNSQILAAILINFLINVLLMIGKIVVAILTNSMSVIASLVDSVLDFLSTFIIYIVNRLAAQNDWKVKHSYPIGRSRLEPLGVLIFSIIIVISFFQVGQESFKRLFFSDPKNRIPAAIGIDAIVIMTVTIIAKFGCWIWCKSNKSSSVQALAQDAMTDVVFNSVSLLMPTIGHWFNIWWFDPLGALILSIYIIINWGITAFEHINNLTGAAADTLDYKVILYLAYRFAEPIKQITALKCYHVGDNLNVEIDLVFANDKNLSFKDCHDLAEALQYSIESLPNVERAFVHIDYMSNNYRGHLK